MLQRPFERIGHHSEGVHGNRFADHSQRRHEVEYRDEARILDRDTVSRAKARCERSLDAV
jgi:hypothetical protein